MPWDDRLLHRGDDMVDFREVEKKCIYLSPSPHRQLRLLRLEVKTLRRMLVCAALY